MALKTASLVIPTCCGQLPEAGLRGQHLGSRTRGSLEQAGVRNAVLSPAPDPSPGGLALAWTLESFSWRSPDTVAVQL